MLQHWLCQRWSDETRLLIDPMHILDSGPCRPTASNIANTHYTQEHQALDWAFHKRVCTMVEHMTDAEAAIKRAEATPYRTGVGDTAGLA